MIKCTKQQTQTQQIQTTNTNSKHKNLSLEMLISRPRLGGETLNQCWGRHCWDEGLDSLVTAIGLSKLHNC